MKRHVTLFLKGMGMGAADSVPGVSGGTIAFVTGIYQELIETIRRFGPSAIGALREHGLKGLIVHLNLGFLIPLLAGVAASVLSLAHLVSYLLEHQTLLLNAFFFGLVVASAIVVARRLDRWRLVFLLPLALGALLAHFLPAILPSGGGALMLFVAGAIAISAMLLPGVSGSFLLLTMGMYHTVIDAIKTFDVVVMGQFALGCLLGLFTFSRVLSWLFKHHYSTTLYLLIGFILGSLPVLWPWRSLESYTMSPGGEVVPLKYKLLSPEAYTAVTGEPAHLWIALALALVGFIVVVAVGERSGADSSRVSTDRQSMSKE
ncbi:DUF368 domain-containing protein [uncultured Kushneria sp.]|uniref:DUF368 domain-containing protein n=1 Tax=uncultured Kushneria sp. TaxID=905033 RepID=UPI00261F03FF|nr:DUF368 domain-containing protein [uncultured Kushneria sp.]